MQILDRSVYVGPSLYAHFPVIRLELDLGALEAWPTGKLGPEYRRRAGRGPARPGRARLLVPRARRLPAAHARGRRHLARPRARARRHRAAERRRRGSHVRQDAQRGQARRLHGRLRIRAARRRRRGRRARRCGCCARCCRSRCVPPGSVPEGWNWPEARDDFIRFAQRRALGPSTASLVRAAEARGIPWLRLNDQSLVQLGHGKYQQRIQATVSGRTPHIAVELASDKEETNKILASLGLPVPRQELVQSEAQAVRAASRIGFPVVTKPYNGNHGRGISIRLTTDAEVAHGFNVATRAFALGDRRDLPRRRRSSPARRQRRAGRGDAAHARARRRRRRAQRSCSSSRS